MGQSLRSKHHQEARLCNQHQQQDVEVDKAVSKDIENYDKSKLGKVEAKDGATPAQSRDMVMAGIEYHKGRDSMKKVETVEKNSLPTKEDIEKEKRESAK